MLSINQRLKYFLEIQELTHRYVARQLNINEKQFNNWMNTTKPSIEGLEKIILHFKNLNVRWLMTGEGEPIILENQIKSTSDVENRETMQQIKSLVIGLYDMIGDTRSKGMIPGNGNDKGELFHLK